MAAYGQLVGLLRRAGIEFDANSITLTPTTVNIEGNLNLDGGITLLGDVQAGEDGDAGKLISYPATANKGYLSLEAANASGDYWTKITNAAQTANRTATIPDLSGVFALSTAALSLAEVDVLDGASAVSQVASKAVIADASLDVIGLRNVDISGKLTGASLVLESLNPLTINLNDVASLKFDNAAISGFSASAAANAEDVYIGTAAGGTATADTVGPDGGNLVITTGAGADGGAHTSNNPNGGDGGDILLSPGSGGTAGGGTGKNGRPGRVKLASGLFQYNDNQLIDMNDAAVTLTTNPKNVAGTLLTSNILLVDANSGGTEDLILPADFCDGLTLLIANTGGEDIVVKDAGGATVCTISTGESAAVFSCGNSGSPENNNPNWYGGVLKST